ncbi:MAG: hypothetical protein HQ498_13360 [Pseudohongiella sp.]|nr:hypothetical protein [Pseudohongiella sp.]
MPNTREQDRLQSLAPDRSDRIFSQQDLWYFKIREGDEIGPFRYRSEAQSNLDGFMEQLRNKLKHTQQA